MASARTLVIVTILGSTQALVHLICPDNTKCLDNTDPVALYKGEFSFNVEGHNIEITYHETSDFELKCDGIPLDSPSLPRLPHQGTVKTAYLKNCILPTNSISSALSSLNLNVTSELCMDEVLSDRPLTRGNLADLQVSKIRITSGKPLQATSDALRDLPHLDWLWLINVTLTNVTLTNLPKSLTALVLRKNALIQYPDEMLKGLPNLVYINLEENPESLIEPPRLSLMPRLKNVVLQMSLRPPPAGWLAGLSLDELSLQYCNLTDLPTLTFENASVKKLNLGANRFTSLRNAEGGVWLQQLRPSLRELDLSDNELLRSVDWLPDVKGHLKNIEILNLSNNPMLGSLCGFSSIFLTPSLSPLPNNLRELILRNTSAKRICTDWYNGDLDKLQTIDLRRNDIESLSFRELQMKRRVQETGVRPKVTLKLSDNPKLQSVDATQEDNDKCSAISRVQVKEGKLELAKVNLQMEPIQCDCSNYWFGRILRSCEELLHASKLKCNGKPSLLSLQPKSLTTKESNLQKLPLEDLVCMMEVARCVSGCECGFRELGNLTVLRCEAGAENLENQLEAKFTAYSRQGMRLALLAAPQTLQRIPAFPTLIELQAPNNSIRNLPDKLPPNLQILDLRYNQLQHISYDSVPRHANLSLAGNPFDCSCDSWRELNRLQTQIFEYNELECSKKTEAEACPPPNIVAIVVPIVVLALAAAIALPLIYRLVTPRLKRFLFQHGYCVSWVYGNVDDAAPGKKYDVFVSFANEDADFVARELVPSLESRGYRLCVHYRDWSPGDGIAVQIERSVLASRRTLLVLTPHYAAAKWTRAEFSAAHAASLRRRDTKLVVLLKAPVSPETLDRDLHAHISNHTYLDWSRADRWGGLFGMLPAKPGEGLEPLPEQAKLDGVRLDIMAGVETSPGA